MSKITLMAGNPQSLCRAWHALQQLERSKESSCRAPGCPARAPSATRSRQTPGDNT